jgi:hypothetical protein
LDCIGPGGDEGIDNLAHIFKADKKARLVADAVIDGDIQAAPLVEESVHPGFWA